MKSSDYYYKAVLWAVENNITAGTSATTFGPNEGCTRGQIMTFLYKAAGSPSVSGSNPFRDVASGDYFYRPVLWAVRNNITAGTSATTFSPNDGCTRGRSSPSCTSTTLPERGKESSPPGLPEGSFCVYFSR